MRHLAVVMAITASACSSDATLERAEELDCRPIPKNPDDQALPASSGWSPTFFAVDPRGTYTAKSPLDTGATAATTKPIAELGLRAGDYVGFREQGAWYWHGNSGPQSSGLGAVFVDSKGKLLKPAKSGQEQGFGTPPTYFGNLPTDIPEDFWIPSDRETIVRIPNGAKAVAFTGGDSHYGDNNVAGEFGVVIFQPNRPAKTVAASGQEASAEVAVEGDAYTELGLAELAGDAPEARFFSSSPFAAKATKDNDSQWRGSYNLWKPEWSRYGVLRESNRHWGWDIFAPPGATVVAPVWPSRFDPVSSNSFGQTAVFTFKSNGKIYHLFYAHLNDVIGAGRTINSAEDVGHAGCTGSAVTQNGCVTPYPNGTRNSHVHVGLFRDRPNKPSTQPADALACNPSAFLKWKFGR